MNGLPSVFELTTSDRMSIGVFASEPQAVESPVKAGLLPSQIADMEAAAVQRWLGCDLSIIESRSGELLHAGIRQPLLGERALAPVRRDALRRRQPAVVEFSSGAVLMALPLPQSSEFRRMAVGAFLARPVRTGDELEQLAADLDIPIEQATDWAATQVVWHVDLLDRLARLLFGRMAAESRANQLAEEVEKLSDHLASTFEEISLIYRLTQNLNISRREEELARLAVDWLVDILPAEGIAIQLVGRRGVDPVPGGEVPAPELITADDCTLDNQEFTRFIEHLRLQPGHGPLVVNRATQRDPAWPFPQIREFVVCPIESNGHHCGWLAAFNHRRGGEFGSAAEFGSAEVDLLCSVSAILGIHGGNTELYRQQADLLAGIVRALTSAIDAKDPYTCGHSERVARVAVRLAQELGCSPETVETIYLSGLLHDVGKIGIDDNVLRKPGRLTDAEFEHIKTHARIGYNILVDLKQLGQVLPVVLHHHESWDGRGYPNGLAAEEIPLLARIVAVADAFDAMGSDRPYRRGMDPARLDEVIRGGAGKQWDPRVVEAFFRAREDIAAIARPMGDRPSGETHQFI
jgi:hypothetical protein